MIAPSAIEAFLNRRLIDMAKGKTYSDEQLRAKLDALVPVPHMHTKPTRSQMISFLCAAHFPGCLHFLDPGLGKSKGALDLIAWRIARNEVRRALVLVPNVSNVTEWTLGEGLKHQPSLTYAAISGAPNVRQAAFDGDAQVTVITYQGFLRLVSRWHEFTDRKGRKKRKLVLDVEKCQKAGAQFQFVVLDESTYVRTHESAIYRALVFMQPLVPFRLALTGTPMDDPADLWAQFRVIDGGETLGPALGLYRAAFFTAKKRFFGGPFSFDYVFKRGMKDQLARMIAHRSIRIEESEELSLPEIVGGIVRNRDKLLVRDALFSPELWKQHEETAARIREAAGARDVAEAAYYRMRQLCAGYVVAKTETGESIEVKFKDNPKADALVSLLRELPKDRGVLIFHVYKATGRVIDEALKKARIPYVAIDGDVSHGRRAQALEDFRAHKVRCLRANEAAAYGLNLQGAANYVIFFETPSSPMVRVQMEKRVFRMGQPFRVFVYDLVVRGSIDERILKALVAGRDLFEDIVGRQSRVV